MNKYYVTFGFAHKDTKGRSLANCYTVIEAATQNQARKIMFDSPLGQQWAFMYKSAQDAGVLKYGLNLVSFTQL